MNSRTRMVPGSRLTGRWSRRSTHGRPLGTGALPGAFGVALGLVLLAAVPLSARSGAGSSAVVESDDAVQRIVEPNANLLVEEIPPIPEDIAEAARPYTEIRSAGFGDWHPQRREMLISTRFASATQIHRVRVPLGARSQLTFFQEPVRGATYDPVRGDFFVFLKDTGGDEFYQVYRYDFSNGRSTLLTDGVKRHAMGPFSRAGDRLVIERVDADDKGAFTDFFTVDPRSPSTMRKVMRVRGGGWGVTDWGADDRSWLMTEYISINQSHLWLFDFTTGSMRRISRDVGASGETKVAHAGARFTADGTAVLTATDEAGEFRQLTRIDLASGEYRALTGDIPWDVSSYAPSPDRSTFAFFTNEQGYSRLFWLDAENWTVRSGPELPLGVAGSLSFHPSGDALAFRMTSASTAGDVFSVSPSTGEITRWTESETGGLDTSSFVEPELVRWTSFDGREISGFLYRPRRDRYPGPRPVILNIHGGPEGQSRPTFKGRTNYYLDELGIAVLYPNVRGSAGFGKTFLQLDNGFKREDSYRDIEALLDWIDADPSLDGGQVMVTGGSYGGHMTFAVATYFSDRICCSLPVVGISNLRTFLDNTQGYRRDLRRVEYGDERDPEMYAFLERIAPLNQAEKIRKPIFIVHGRNDPRVPVSESEQIVGEVRKNGVPAWYLVAEDEGHGFRKKPNSDFQFYATVAFVREFLLDG